MTFCRSVSLGSLMNIFVPGTKPSGFARNLSRLASYQVMFASFIAGEKSYPGTEALLLPTMPASDGPTSAPAIVFGFAACDWTRFPFRKVVARSRLGNDGEKDLGR